MFFTSFVLSLFTLITFRTDFTISWESRFHGTLGLNSNVSQEALDIAVMRSDLFAYNVEVSNYPYNDDVKLMFSTTFKDVDTTSQGQVNLEVTLGFGAPPLHNYVTSYCIDYSSSHSNNAYWSDIYIGFSAVPYNFTSIDSVYSAISDITSLSTGWIKLNYLYPIGCPSYSTGTNINCNGKFNIILIAKLNYFSKTFMDATTDLVSFGEQEYNRGYDNGRQGAVDEYKDSVEFEELIEQHEEWSYNAGYSTGYNLGINDNTRLSQMQTIFVGIIDIGLMPINFFLKILNFEVFGINIGGFVTGLFTITIVVILFRMFFGGSGGKSEK